MKRAAVRAKKTAVPRSVRKQLPVIIEKGEDGYYIVECPVLPGCFTQGKTVDEALRNIREVIDLILEEEDARTLLREYKPTEISFHTITL
jgi:predicted RNase H-like HicB family nuclease